MLTLAPVLAPASAFFVDDPFAGLPAPALPVPDALLPSEGAAVPADVRAPLLEAYRTSLLEPDVTAVLEARAAALGLPVAEIPWTHDVDGPRPLSEALAALAAADTPSMSTDDLARAQASADALPRDLQVALAKLVWRVRDAGHLQAQAFAPLTPEERRALATFDDPAAFEAAVPKVDVGAVLGAARAVDQAVKEAEPVLRKWSLLLEARRALDGRALTPAGLAAGASMLGDEAVTTTWALGLADRPRPETPELPALALPQALALFYRAHGIPVTDGAALGLLLLGNADPAVADPLARAVVATTAASVYVAQGAGETSVDPAEFLRLDAEAARIAAANGASADDLAALERYVAAAKAVGDTPALVAAELLLQASRDLGAAAPAARRVQGPALVMPARVDRHPLPGGGSLDIHDEPNGTSVSVDVTGDGRHEFWSPAVGTRGVRLDPENCALLVSQDNNNDGRVQEGEKVLDVPSMCSVENDVKLQDPYGYFVVGGDRSTVYGPSLGGIRFTAQNRKDDVSGAEKTFNSTIAGQFLNSFGNVCFPFVVVLGCDGSSPEDAAFDAARRSTIIMNSQHYQVLTWDLGGDDRYLNNAGGTYNWSEPYTLERIQLGDFAGVVALAVDEAGDDAYATTRAYTVGSAQLGVGLLVDRAGDDAYAAPKDAIASSAGARDHPKVHAAECVSDDSECDGVVRGDTGTNERAYGTQWTYDPEATSEPSGPSPANTTVRKAATAFAALLDLEGDDAYRGGDRTLAFANMSYAFLLDLDGNDRYASGDFGQGVANATTVRTCAGHEAQTGTACGGFATPAVAALVDARGDDVYTTTGRDNFTQGRGVSQGYVEIPVYTNSDGERAIALGAMVPVPTVGLLLDLQGEDEGIRRNGNVTVGDGLVQVGFRTRHVVRGDSDPTEHSDRPDHGVSLALDLDTPEASPDDPPSPSAVRPEGTYAAVPASHVDMDEDPFFALDLYVDVPRLFVLGSEARTKYEHDAVVLVDLGGRDTYEATVGAATFDWNAVTSYSGHYRGEAQEHPAPEGQDPVFGSILFACPDDEGGPHPCTVGAYETGRVAPVALALDLEGADTYHLVTEKGKAVRGFGYGHGGVGALYDLGRLDASDLYNVTSMGLGAAELFGAGLLFDAEGNDDYRMVDGHAKGLPATSYGLGFAHTGGVAVAIDARRSGGPATDRYRAADMSLGSILVDLRQEYAVFLDAGGEDAYVGGARSLGHVENPVDDLGNALERPESARVGGPLNSFVGLDMMYCYYVRNGNSDTQATFLDDGFEKDRYDPLLAAWHEDDPDHAEHRDDAEWHHHATPVAPRPLADDPVCSPFRFGGLPPVESQDPLRRKTSPGYALGVDNLDAYLERHARDAVLDPVGSLKETGDSDTTDLESVGGVTVPAQAAGAMYFPLDEVFAARAILLAPAAIYLDENGDALPEGVPTVDGEWPVRVVAVRGADSVLENARAFAEYLVQDTLPRFTCSFVPPVEGATDVAGPDMSYRQSRRDSHLPGYCATLAPAAGIVGGAAEIVGDAVNGLDPGEGVDPGATVDQTFHDANEAEARYRRYKGDVCDVKENYPPGSALGDIEDPLLGIPLSSLPPDSICGQLQPFVNIVPTLPDTIPDGSPVGGLTMPLSAMQIPVLAEALRALAPTDVDLQAQVDEIEAALAEALAFALERDPTGARSALSAGFATSTSTSPGGNPCEDAVANDCRDAGTVDFYVLRDGVVRPLGSWDERRAPPGLDVIHSGVTYEHSWPTDAVAADGVSWPDGPYDLLVHTTYREDGNVGTGAASVPLRTAAPVSDEAIRRVHDEYGYWPGASWLSVSVDNPPAYLSGLSSPGHFRPGDVTKTATLVFSEPVTVEVKLSGQGIAERTITGLASPHAGACGSFIPLLHGSEEAVAFQLPVDGLGAGLYTLTVKATDCQENVVEFPVKVFGDADAPFADLALTADHVRSGSRVACADGKRECLGFLLVDRVDAAAPQSPTATWTVDLKVVLSSGLPDATCADRQVDVKAPVHTYRIPAGCVKHGATYRFSLLAKDAAGNEQKRATVREVVYDEFAPRVVSVSVPPTVRPDGTLVVEWVLDSADPAFPSDAEGVYVDWATARPLKEGETVEHIWREVPERFVAQGEGVARIPVEGILDEFLITAPDDETADSWAENHTKNLADGGWFEVRLRAFDVHGNTEGTDPWDDALIWKTFDVSRFDTISPDLTAPPTLEVTHDRATIDLTLSEPGTAVVQYGLEGSDLGLRADSTPHGNGTLQSVELTGLRQASDYSFRVVARDLVGNERVFGPYEFSTDRVVTVAVTAPKADAVARGQARVEWSATDYRVDPYLTYQLKLSTDGGETFPFDLTPANAKPLYERSAPLRVFVFDTRDWPDSAKAVVRVLANNTLNRGAPLAFDSPVFRIDNAPPLTTARLVGEGANGWFRTPVTVEFLPSDTANVSGIRRLEHSEDNVTFTSVDGSEASGAKLVVATEGRHVVYFRSVDTLGNVEPVRSVRFNVDLGVPDATLVLADGDAASAERTVDLEISARDVQSGVASVVVRTTGIDPLVVPGERFRNGAFVQPFTFPAGDGERTVQVDVTDVAGNRAVVQRTLRIDTTAPAFEETVFDRVAYETASGVVRLGEPASLTVYVKRANDVGYQGRVEYAEPTTAHRVVLNGLVPSTKYALRLVATDPLGNKAEATYDFTTLEDLAAPTEPASLAVVDGGHGALEVAWTPAADNVGIDHYVVLRSVADAGEYAPVGLAYRSAYLDDDLVPGTRYAYRVQAVDSAGNAGPTSALGLGRATTAPALESGLVDPPAAPAAEAFTYTITYRDGDGDAPVFVRVYIDGEVHDMVKERGVSGADAYRQGVRYVHHATLEPTRLSTGVHTFRFEASDGASVVRFPVEGLDDAVGPAVFAAPGVAVGASWSLGAAIREAPALDVLAALGAVAAVALLARRRWT